MAGRRILWDARPFLESDRKIPISGSKYNEDPERFEIPEINRLLNDRTYAASLGLLTGVGLPLIARQKVVGLLFIFRSYACVFSSNDYTLLSSFANQAAIAVQNAQFYTQVNQEKGRLSALLDSWLMASSFWIPKTASSAVTRLYHA